VIDQHVRAEETSRSSHATNHKTVATTAVVGSSVQARDISTSSLPSPVSTARNQKQSVVNEELHRGSGKASQDYVTRAAGLARLVFFVYGW
jgi:hypothetical protein